MAADNENVQIILEAVSRARDEISNTLRDLDKLTAANDKGSASFNRASEAATKHDSALGKVRVAGIAAVAAMTLIVEKAIELGKSLVESAERIIEHNAALFRAAEAAETTVEAYGKLAYAAKLAHVEQEDLGQSLRHLALAMTAARDPSSEAAQTFTQLGIATKGIENRKPTEVLLEMAASFEVHSGAAQKSAAATALLGRGSREMVNFLNQGTDAIKAQGLAGQRLGAVISDEAAHAAEEFSRKLDMLRASVTGFISQAVTPALPILQGYADQLLEVAHDQQGVVTATAAVITVFNTLIQIVTGVYVVFQTLGILLGNVVAADIGIVETSVKGAINLFNVLTSGVMQLIKTFVELVGTLAGVGTAFSQLMNRDFSGAAKTAQETFLTFGSKVLELGKDFSDVFAKSAAAIGGTVVGVGTEIVNASKGASGELGNLLDGAGKVFKALEDAKAKADEPAGKKKKEEPYGERLDPNAQIKRELESKRKLGESQTNLVADQIAKEEALNEKKFQDLLIGEGTYLAAIEGLNDRKLDNEKRIAREIVEFEHAQRLLDIENLKDAEERKRLIRDENAGYANRLSAIDNKASADVIAGRKRQEQAEKDLANKRVLYTAQAYDDIATVAAAFGSKEMQRFKAVATAQALMNTYSSAVGAYNAMVNIPYVGPVVAVVAAAAAVAAGLVNVAKINSISFAEGGIVPGTPSAVDNRVANVASGELIVSSASTRSLIDSVGMGGINRLLAGQIPMFGFESSPSVRASRASSFATGGIVGDGASTASPRQDSIEVSLGFLNGRNAMRDFLERDGTSIIIDQLSRRGNSVVA